MKPLQKFRGVFTLKEIITSAELIIFDLDGTLYEGTEHFDYYAKLILEQIGEHNRKPFMNDYENMKKGKHAVTIGKGYDASRDVGLTVNPFTLEVETVHEWDGSEWTVEKMKHTYKERSITFDFENIVAIGDGWWLPYALGKHYGLTNEQCYMQYVKTKEYMVTEEFTMPAIAGLRDWLLSLKKGKKIVLMTNSEEEDVARLLKELKLETIFEHSITSAMKPSSTLEHFQSLLEEYGVKAEHSISIGDNFINEIGPALQLGMKAVFIQPQENDYTHPNLIKVNTIKECYT